jgi:hypothetical protein
MLLEDNSWGSISKHGSLDENYQTLFNGQRTDA